MKVLQGAPKFTAPGVGAQPQQGSPVFPGQYPAPYSPVQTTDGLGGMLDTILPLIILMMVMGMMMPMMRGITTQSD